MVTSTWRFDRMGEPATVSLLDFDQNGLADIITREIHGVAVQPIEIKGLLDPIHLIIYFFF